MRGSDSYDINKGCPGRGLKVEAELDARLLEINNQTSGSCITIDNFL